MYTKKYQGANRSNMRNYFNNSQCRDRKLRNQSAQFAGRHGGFNSNIR